MLAAHGLPDILVESQIRGGILTAEVEFQRATGGTVEGGIARVEGCGGGAGGVGGRVGLGREAGPERPGGGIVLTHGGQAENKLQRAQHPGGGVSGVHHGVAAHVRPHQVGRGAVGIHVVGAVLGIVFHYHHHRFLPDRAFGKVLDEAAQGQVVVGGVRQRAKLALARSEGVVVGQADDAEVRQLVGSYQAVEVLLPHPLAVHILHFHIEAGIRFAEMALDGRHAGFALVHELAVAAIAAAGAPAIIPQKAIFGFGYLTPVALEVVVAAPVAVVTGPAFLHEIGGVGGRAPVVAVGAYFSIHVKIIEQHKLAGEGVVIGRDLLGKQAEASIAVARR